MIQEPGRERLPVAWQGRGCESQTGWPLGLVLCSRPVAKPGGAGCPCGAFFARRGQNVNIRTFQNKSREKS